MLKAFSAFEFRRLGKGRAGVTLPLVARVTTYTGTGANLTQAHTFGAGTVHAVIALHLRETTGSTLVPTVTVNGVAATSRASSRFSTTFSEGAYIFERPSPTSGNIVLGSVIGSQGWVITVYEFSRALTFDAGAGIAQGATGAFPTITTESVTLSGAGLVIYANTFGATSGRPIATAFTGDSFVSSPDTLPVTTYYAAASGLTEYGTGGAKSESYTRNPASGSIYNFRCAAAFTVA